MSTTHLMQYVCDCLRSALCVYCACTDARAQRQTIILRLRRSAEAETDVQALAHRCWEGVETAPARYME